jgi:hypothetical protein
MKRYDGIDLHSNNCVVVVLDEEDGVVYEKRLPDDLGYLLLELAPYQGRVARPCAFWVTGAEPLGTDATRSKTGMRIDLVIQAGAVIGNTILKKSC